MNTMLKSIAAMAAIIVAMLSGCAPGFSQAQRMAIPSYIYPGAAWTQMEAGAPVARIAIINPNSGPGIALDPSYVSQVKEAKAKGMVVIGYVHTSYGKRDISIVKSEIASYYKWYAIDGIFIDEGASSADMLPYYKQCKSYIHSLAPLGLIVFNAGNEVDEGYMSVADIICSFESEYQIYLTAYKAPAWVTKYPARRFWHIVLNAPTEADMLKAVALGKRRHAGFMFVTNLSGGNPYSSLPSYWDSELKALAAK